MADTTVVVEYAEVKATWMKMYAGEIPLPKQKNFLRQFDGSCQRGGSKNSWIGASADEMFDWLNNGFRSPEFPIGEDYTPHRQGRKLMFADEGELDLALAWSGHDYPYLRWSEIERKPGIRIEAQMNFGGFVDSKVIAEYGAWLAGLLEGLETQGYDIELDLVSLTRSKYVGSHGGIDKTIIRVKRENELSDFTEWSPMFSPAGFRMLFFTAYAIGAEKLGKILSLGHGMPTGNRFRAEYNAETATLFLGSHKDSVSFPMERMTREVNEVMGW